MRRFAFLIVPVFLFPLAAFSQIPKRVIVFGGYTYLHAGGSEAAGGAPGYSLNGWSASVEGKITPLFSAVADFGQQYGTSVNSTIGSSTLVVREDQTTALFGPQISIPGVPHVRPFAHALIGVDHITEHARSNFPAATTISNNNFATALGGGFDIRLSSRIWFRPAQVDWLHVSEPAGGVNDFRFSAGIVFHL